MCERWVGDWTDCNILTPSSSVFSSTSFSFCWAAQLGVLRAQALCWELVLTATWTPTNSNSVAPGYIIVWRPPASCERLICTRLRSRLYLDIFDRMHLFLDWWLGRRSICYIELVTNLREGKLNFVVWKNLWHISAPFFCYQLIQNVWLILHKPSLL